MRDVAAPLPTPSQRMTPASVFASRRENASATTSRSASADAGHVLFARAPSGAIADGAPVFGGAGALALAQRVPENEISPCSPMQRYTVACACVTHGAIARAAMTRRRGIGGA
jgi:hypothetical protein